MRFIPTRVGNTYRRRHQAVARPVHPHARGEHPICTATSGIAGGSSPRAWGTQKHRRRELRHLRFIPTRVGNTSAISLSALTIPVHPHARGEHAWRIAVQSGESGSSPRAWGTQFQRRYRLRHRRFIPTRVGNTQSPGQTICPPSVHPHARGEHLQLRMLQNSSHGSSPRAWGTQQTAVSILQLRRFIPTRVGNTVCAEMSQDMVTVHPHARGEHVRTRISNSNLIGSSPRAWGTPDNTATVDLSNRFIPTRVGNTRILLKHWKYLTVHPHARGEHSMSWQRSSADCGSSPRAWGTPN